MAKCSHLPYLVGMATPTEQIGKQAPRSGEMLARS